jgi:hypothetical protein
VGGGGGRGPGLSPGARRAAASIVDHPEVKKAATGRARSPDAFISPSATGSA